MGSVVFGSLTDDYSGEKSGDDGQAKLPPVGESEHVENSESNDCYQACRQVGSYTEGFEKLHQAGTFLGADCIYSYD